MCHQDAGWGGRGSGKEREGMERREGKSLERRDESQRGRGWKKVRSEKRNGKWEGWVMIQSQQELTEPLGGAGSKPGEWRNKT